MRRIVILLLALLTASGASAGEPRYLVTFAESVEVTEELVQQVARTYAAAVEDVRDDQVILRVSVSRAQLLSTDTRVRTITALSTELIDWNTGVGYTYDDAGNIRQIGTDTFAYDAVGRLVQGQTAGITRNFSYDAFGNRTACTEGGVPCQTSSHTYSAFTNQSSALQYDPAGNVTSASGRVYDYDALHMQIRDRVGATSREYVYTADDERIAVSHAGAWWNWTIRDPSGRVLREFTSQGAGGTSQWKWTKDHIWRDSLLLATIQPGATPGSTATYHYHLDHLGTPRRITDAADRIIGHHDYHPFGPERPGGHDEPSLTALKYTGHERDGNDPEALDYMHARYYSAAMGRFLSPDPVISEWTLYLPQGWNRYSYVMNNPMRFTDPAGREIECVPGEKEGDPPICGEKIDVEGEEPKVEPQPLPPMVFAGMLPLETQQLRMRERDERERAQIAREQQRIGNCFDDHRFSGVIGDLTGSQTARSVTGFLEIGSEISLAGDVVATAYKATHTSLGNQPYASGMNAAFRAFGSAVGNPALGRSLTKFGDKATPAAAVFGAFTAAYNATTYIQCRAGLL